MGVFPNLIAMEFMQLLLLLLLLFNKGSNARLAENDSHNISPKTKAPQYQLIEGKKR